MPKLTYINNMSVDGYVEDQDGHYNFGPMSDDVFAAYTDLLRPVSTYLYGRRLYETMAPWETMPSLAAQSPLTSEFSDVWKSADKVVYSTTLAATATASTRIEASFDATEVQRLKATTTGDLTVGGANLAAQALRAGLLDECHLFIWPTTVGSGKPALPTHSRHGLDLIDERRFSNGTLLVSYLVGTR